MIKDKLDAFLFELQESIDYSGHLRVTYKDKIIYEKSIGFADRENKIPIDKNSHFTFYSLSKPFCAIGLMKLKDKGLVDIDSHPEKYLPEMQGFDERLTIRNILYHTSGLPDFEQNKDFCKKYIDSYSDSLIRDHLKAIKSYPMYFAPNTSGMYANINYVIPALIIENVSGFSYADYMKKEVFEPLQMKTALVDRKGLYIENRAKGYERMDGNTYQVQKSYQWMLGAGDIVGTADDVYCVNKAIKNKLLLKAKTWEEILKPSPINSMGLGCTISNWHGKKRITHNGGHTGFRTLHIQLLEDDFDIILLSNIGNDARSSVAEAVYESFYCNDSGSSDIVEMDKGYI